MAVSINLRFCERISENPRFEGDHLLTPSGGNEETPDCICYFVASSPGVECAGIAAQSRRRLDAGRAGRFRDDGGLHDTHQSGEDTPRPCRSTQCSRRADRTDDNKERQVRNDGDGTRSVAADSGRRQTRIATSRESLDAYATQATSRTGRESENN